jgi:prepilin-type N-terminal cleavage/methylation domain-containing protein
MRRRKKTERGFTLLEILLALSITAVIFVILLAALRLGYRSQEKGRGQEKVYQHMRILNDRLTWLMRGAYPYTVKEEGEEKLVFSGGSDSLGFVTTSTDIYSDTAEDMAGLKWVRIFTDDEGLKVEERIYFVDKEPAEEDRKEFLLDYTVADIEFEYLDLGEKNEGEDWTGDWNTEKKVYLPAAVKATLTLVIDGREFFPPPVLAAMRTGRSLGAQEKEKAE